MDSPISSTHSSATQNASLARPRSELRLTKDQQRKIKDSLVASFAECSQLIAPDFLEGFGGEELGSEKQAKAAEAQYPPLLCELADRWGVSARDIETNTYAPLLRSLPSPQPLLSPRPSSLALTRGESLGKRSIDTAADFSEAEFSCIKRLGVSSLPKGEGCKVFSETEESASVWSETEKTADPCPRNLIREGLPSRDSRDDASDDLQHQFQRATVSKDLLNRKLIQDKIRNVISQCFGQTSRDLTAGGYRQVTLF